MKELIGVLGALAVAALLSAPAHACDKSQALVTDVPMYVPRVYALAFAAWPAWPDEKSVKETVTGTVAKVPAPGLPGKFTQALKINGEAFRLAFSESAFSKEKIGDKLPKFKEGDRLKVTGYRLMLGGIPTFSVESLEVNPK